MAQRLTAWAPHLLRYLKSSSAEQTEIEDMATMFAPAAIYYVNLLLRPSTTFRMTRFLWRPPNSSCQLVCRSEQSCSLLHKTLKPPALEISTQAVHQRHSTPLASCNPSLGAGDGPLTWFSQRRLTSGLRAEWSSGD
jgi:hypothetical protein